MRLVTFETDGHAECGVLVGDQVVPVEPLLGAAGLGNPPVAGGRPTVKSIVELGPEAWSALAQAASAVDPDSGHPIDSVHLLAPVTDPDKILCIGLNYRDHAEEIGLPEPETPLVFAKFRNSLIGPADTIVLPEAGEQFDYEAELAVVIGRSCRNVLEQDALEYVAGVMAFNDFSARDLQMQTSQWTIGKAIDTFAPCGPSLVFLDEIDDVQSLKVSARVNGHTVQAGTTASMIFSTAQIIAHLSRTMTLEPGDIIATGTPAGVGISRNPQILIQPGDVVEIEIEGIGVLRNPVAGPSPAPVVS